MPILQIRTNVELDKAAALALTKKASAAVAQGLGKAESWVMCAIETGFSMTLGGDESPCALVTLKSFGFKVEDRGSLAKILCDLLDAELEIAGDRVYLELFDLDRQSFATAGALF